MTFGFLFRKKPIARGDEVSSSHRTLSWLDLTAYGIATTVGSGIFVMCGQTAKEVAGPAVSISTIIAGILSVLTGICYVEFASAMPISGSGYVYLYCTIGEMVGWIMGWNLTLEYAFSAAAVAGAFSSNLVVFLKNVFDINVSEFLYNLPWTNEEHPIFKTNILAATICVLAGLAVSMGVSFNTRFTNGITAVNISTILIIIVVGFCSLSAWPSPHWTDPSFSPFGISGIIRGAKEMFFCFVGFDTISSLAGEAINPIRDLPIAMFATVLIACLLYVGAGFVVTGMTPYMNLTEKAPLANVFLANDQKWMFYIVLGGALLCTMATVFASLMGQPKIWQAISKDGLLPRRIFNRTNRHGTPIRGVAITTLLAAGSALFINVDGALIDMICTGVLIGMAVTCMALIAARLQQHPTVKTRGYVALLVFTLGSIVDSYLVDMDKDPSIHWSIPTTIFALSAAPSMIYLQYLFWVHGSSMPSLSTSFACPLMPLLPLLASLSNTFVIMQSKDVAYILLQWGIWTLLGLFIYFNYGVHHSVVGQYSVENSPVKKSGDKKVEEEDF